MDEPAPHDRHLLGRDIRFKLVLHGVDPIAAFRQAIPGTIPVNATMDSEDRFYGTLFDAYGAALLWCIRGVETKGKVVGFLALTFFATGLARLVSMAVVVRLTGSLSQ